MCHSPATGEMWLEAITSTYRARSSINARLAELQAAREAACACNQPGYQAPRDDRRQRSREEVEALHAARRAAVAARLAQLNQQRDAPRPPTSRDSSRSGAGGARSAKPSSRRRVLPTITGTANSATEASEGIPTLKPF
jgi:hypothetical protein